MTFLQSHNVLTKTISIMVLSAMVITVTPLPLIAQESETPQTTVTTGDAETHLDAQNTANTNTTDTNGDNEDTPDDEDLQEDAQDTTEDETSSSTPETLETEETKDTSTTTPEALVEELTSTTTPENVNFEGLQDNEEWSEEDDNATSSLDGFNTAVENINDAHATTTATSTASTGENTAQGQEGDALVVTGDATATANVLNVVNTNITDSYGFFVLMNMLSQMSGNIDLSNLNFEPVLCDDCPPCDENCLNAGSLGVYNQNNANIYNSVHVMANTGQNTATSTSGNATVLTGDAKAGANVVNIANTNITGSNYLLVNINHFESWAGDLIFPSASFFTKLFQPLIIGPEFMVDNVNNADIDNNVTATAETGANTASDGGEEGGSVVATGDATSSSNVYNQVNTNLIGGSSIFILIRVWGTWTGDVFSAPEGVTWEETSHGIEIQGLNMGTLAQSSIGSAHVTNGNNAHITNDVSVIALTGENNAETAGGTAAIQTGNAKAGANVINIVNTNVVGHNWLFAMINIFGDWNGNVAFGQPDLWIGPVYQGENPAEQGDEAPYLLTVKNNGDADATNVQLTSTPSGPLDFALDGALFNEGVWSWNIGDIPAGATRTFDISGIVGEASNDYVLDNTFTVDALEPDANPEDNTDSIAFNVNVASGHRSPRERDAVEGANMSGGNAKLTLTKTTTTTGTVKPGESIPFMLTLKNEGAGSAYDVIVEDMLTLDDKIVQTDSWDLQEVLPGEEIIITYDLKIADDAQPGTYYNHALATGFDVVGTALASEKVSIPFTIDPPTLAQLFAPLITTPTVDARNDDVVTAPTQPTQRTIESAGYLASAYALLTPTSILSLLGIILIFAFIWFIRRRRQGA